jgi:GNAT superfamily N-acetyltransferase
VIFSHVLYQLSYLASARVNVQEQTSKYSTAARRGRSADWHAMDHNGGTSRDRIRLHTADGITVDVRPATSADVSLLLDFFHAMAAFEKLPLTATADSIRDALFGDAPAAHALLIFVDDRAIGYAIYYFTFSTMVGKRGLWLEDLFVVPDHRGKGVGEAVMSHLATIAVANGCGRFEWIVLDWNAPALRFYERLGARVLPDWRICRLDESQMRDITRR